MRIETSVVRGQLEDIVIMSGVAVSLMMVTCSSLSSLCLNSCSWDAVGAIFSFLVFSLYCLDLSKVDRK